MPLSASRNRRLGALPPSALLGGVGIGLGYDPADVGARLLDRARRLIVGDRFGRRGRSFRRRRNDSRRLDLRRRDEGQLRLDWRGRRRRLSRLGDFRVARKLGRLLVDRSGLRFGSGLGVARVEGFGPIRVLARPEAVVGARRRNFERLQIAVRLRDIRQPIVGRLRSVSGDGAFALAAATAPTPTASTAPLTILAILAAHGAGKFKTIEEGCAAMVRSKTVIEPNAANTRFYEQDMLPRYARLYGALKEVRG